MAKPQELFDRQYQNEPVSQPCSASCMHHHSHPCERCGRQWGNIIPLKQQIAELQSELDEVTQKCLRVSERNAELEQEVTRQRLIAEAENEAKASMKVTTNEHGVDNG